MIISKPKSNKNECTKSRVDHQKKLFSLKNRGVIFLFKISKNIKLNHIGNDR